MADKVKKPSKTIPQNETKAARFVRVVTPRIARAIKSITVIGYCAAPAYEYKPEQVKQILDALRNAEAQLEAKFAAKQKQEMEFQFKP